MPLNNSDYALVIGINDYPKYKFPLKYAKSDAERFRDWLLNADKGGLPEKHVVCLTSYVQGDDLARPVQDEIDDKLYELVNLALENRDQGIKPRRFYFYFSGHGLGLTSLETGLCLPFWSDTRSIHANLKANAYLDYLKKWGLFSEIFFFLDCCRSFIPFAGGHDPSLSLPAPKEGAAASKALVAYATTFTKPAFEAQQALNIHDEARGFFTAALIDALEGKAAAPAGGVPLNNLIMYLERVVPENALKEQKTQEVRFSNEFGRQEETTILFGHASMPNDLKNGLVLESTVRIQLEIRKEHGTDDVKIVIQNAENQPIYSGYEPFSQSLPECEYLVKFQYLSEINIQKVQLKDQAVVETVLPPEIFTPTLLDSARSSHEYYTWPAVSGSRKLSQTALFAGSESRLFIMARYLEIARDKNGNNLPHPPFDFAGKLKLIGPGGAEYLFAPHDIASDPDTGWYVLSVACKAGQYYLAHQIENNNTELMPVYCFDGFQTQVFLMLNNNELMFDAVRISTAPPSVGFMPQNKWTHWSETAYRCLEDEQVELPPSIVKGLDVADFDSPMPGILGCYLLLQRKQKEQAGKAFEHLLSLLDVHDRTACPDIQIIGMELDHPVQEPLQADVPMITYGAKMLVEHAMADQIEAKPDSMLIARMMSDAVHGICINRFQAHPQEEPPFWMLDSIVHATKRAIKYDPSLTAQSLASRLNVPKQKLQFALNFIDSNPNVIDTTMQLQGEKGYEKDKIVQAINQLKSSGKMETSTKPVQVTILYASDALENKNDKNPIDFYKEFIKECLVPLEKKGLVNYWSVDQILPGTIRNEEIHKAIQSTDLVVGLISAGYFSDEETERMHNMAIQLGKRFVPVVVKPCILPDQIVNLGPIPVLNKAVKPVRSWEDRSEAWVEVYMVLEQILTGKSNP